MIIAFCDLKGSTRVLRELGAPTFRNLQSMFFTASNEIISAANADVCAKMNLNKSKMARLEEEFNGLIAIGGDKQAQRMLKLEKTLPKPLARIDKFMGDCTMFYIQCGDLKISTHKVEEQGKCGRESLSGAAVLYQATRTAMQIVSSLIDEIGRIEKEMRLDTHAIKLGSRVGLALGEKVGLSWLGEPGKPGYSYTVTGETVNLAARLEHATKAEFLSCINEEKTFINAYTQDITDRVHLHGTALGQDLVEADRHLIDLYTVCDKRFQVRANEDFIHFLENGNQPVKLRWRRIPFSPQGFDGKQTACLLGGDTASELFRTV